jgi:hypothetical protein
MDTEAVLSRRDAATDRRFYAGMVLLLLAIVLSGFIPTSRTMLAAVQAGHRPPIPLVLHVHAVVMGAWISLLVVQGLLVASGRADLHRRLGMAAFALMPAVVLVMLLMTRQGWMGMIQMPAGMMPPEVLAGTKALIANLLLAQLLVIVLFPVFIGRALALRRRDPGSHKRYMIFGTMLPLTAGLDRLTEALGVSTLPGSGDSSYFWTLVLTLPVIAFDLIRQGRIHKATLVFLGVLLACFAFVHALWGSEGWLATAPRLMSLVGVHGW